MKFLVFSALLALQAGAATTCAELEKETKDCKKGHQKRIDDLQSRLTFNPDGSRLYNESNNRIYWVLSYLIEDEASCREAVGHENRDLFRACID